MSVQSHRDLQVWQKAMRFVSIIYKLTPQFPREEMYGLTSQMRRAAVSVPSNIAEGNSRSTRRDDAYFVSHAKGSLMEAETQVLIAIDLGYVSHEQARESLALITEISKMLTSLRASLLSAS